MGRSDHILTGSQTIRNVDRVLVLKRGQMVSQAVMRNCCGKGTLRKFT